jgi:hypothetical protein
MGAACSTLGRGEKLYKISVGKSEMKVDLTFERPRHRWKDNIKMNLNWIYLDLGKGQWRNLVNTAVILWDT